MMKMFAVGIDLIALVLSAPALSEGALGATVRRSRPTPRRQPEHRRSEDEERSGRQLCQMHN